MEFEPGALKVLDRYAVVKKCLAQRIAEKSYTTEFLPEGSESTKNIVPVAGKKRASDRGSVGWNAGKEFQPVEYAASISPKRTSC